MKKNQENSIHLTALILSSESMNLNGGIENDGISKYYHANGSMLECKNINRATHCGEAPLCQWQLKNKKEDYRSIRRVKKN